MTQAIIIADGKIVSGREPMPYTEANSLFRKIKNAGGNGARVVILTTLHRERQRKFDVAETIKRPARAPAIG
jgi:hypothetical protein